MGNTNNVVRLENDTLMFSGFFELSGKHIFLRHTGKNSLILKPVDKISGDADNYFTLIDGMTKDKTVIECFKVHDAINKYFHWQDGVYYQTPVNAE